MRRRDFLAAAGAGAVAWPRVLRGVEPPVPPGSTADDEDYWRLVRAHFVIPDDRIYMNNGTLGTPPRGVLAAVAEHERLVAETHPPPAPWDELKALMAALLDTDPDGFVFPRNTTEAMSFVAGGIDLEPGDEVLTTDHEHIGGLCPWQLACTRQDATLRVFSLPVPATSAEQLLATVTDALSERTRILTLSHVTFTTGTVLPVERIARVCRERGIVFVVDGAHPPGMMRVSLSGIGADFYASSPHKWLLAPRGSGLLQLAERWRTELWPTIASGGWDDLSLGAHRLNHMGTMDESRLAGLQAAAAFHLAIGVDQVAGRIRFLGDRLRGHLAGIPGLAFASPASPEISTGMLSFSLEGVDSIALQGHLAGTANVRTRVIGEYDYGWMRLSTHVYNTPDEIDHVAELIDEAARNGLPSGP